jgi:hypothetical protein
MNLRGPIALGEETDIRAALFTQDPQLGTIDTPHGRVVFVQVVGITLDELNATEEWSTNGFLEVLAGRDPLLITDLARTSLLNDPGLAQVIRERTEAEGSTCWGVFHDSVRWKVRKHKDGEHAELAVGASIVPAVGRLLRGRTLHGRDFHLHGKHGAVLVRPARRASWRVKAKEELIVSLTAEQARTIQAELQPVRGTYRWPAPAKFQLKVVPSEIKDQDGKVIEVIG